MKTAASRFVATSLCTLTLWGCQHTGQALGPAFGPDLRRAAAPQSAEAGWATWMRAGDTLAAHATFEARSETDPGDALALFGLAETCLHRARFKEAAEAYASLLRSDRPGPLARFAAQRLLQLRDHVPAWPRFIMGLRAELAGSALPPAARSYLGVAALKARHALLEVDDLARPFDAAAEGFSPHWRQAGPISIYPNHDWEAPFAQILGASALEPSYEVEGIDRPTRRVVFDDPVGDPPFSETGVHFLETWLQLERPLEALVHLETAASARVWIDGRVVFDKRTSQGYTRHRYGAAATLSAGTHRVLVQLGVERGDESFTLIVAPADGRELPGSFSAAAPSEMSGQGTIALGQTGPVDDFFADLPSASQAGTHCFMAWLRAVGATEERALGVARDAIRELERLCPSFALLPFAQAHLAQERDDIDMQVGFDAAVDGFTRLTSADPEASFAADKLALLLANQQRGDEALAMVDRAIEASPDQFLLHYHRYRILMSRGWETKAHVALDRAMELDPGNCGLAQAMWMRWSQQERWPTPSSLPPAIAGCAVSIENLAYNHDLPRGDLDAAIARLQKLLARSPRDVNLVLSLARLARRKGDSRRAAELFERASTLAGNKAAARAQHFDMLLASGPRADALASLERWIKESPGSYSLRRARALMAGQNVLEDLRVDGRAIIERYLEAPSFEETAAVYLLDYAAVRVYPDGTQLTLTHNIVRVGNKEGIDTFGEVELPAGALIMGIRTIKADGRIMEPETIPSKPSISMPNLEEGDFIEFEYLEAGGGSHIREGSYLGMRFFFNVFDAPLLRSEYIIDVPSATFSDPLDVVIDRRQDAPQPKITEEGDRRRYHFLTLNAPRAVSEPNAPPSVETLPSILLAHRQSWNDTYKTYRDRILSNARSNVALAEQAAAIRASFADEDSRARAAFRAVSTQIEDDGSGIFAQPAAHILSSGRGDRLIVLKALLDLLEIENEVIMGRSWANDQNEGEIPEIDNWNYTIIRARVDGKQVWLNPTNLNAIYNFVPPALRGNKGLRMGHITATEPTHQDLFVSIPRTGPETTHDVSAQLKIAPSGEATGTVSETFSGQMASLMRSHLDDYPAIEDFSKALARSRSGSFPGISIEGLSVEGRSDPDAPLTVRYTLRSPGFAQQEGATISIDRAFFPSRIGEVYAALPERKLPVALLDQASSRITLKLTFPPGHEALVVSKPVEAQTPFGAFTFVSTSARESVELTWTLKLPIQRISPADYAPFKTFAVTVDEAEKVRAKAAAP